MNTHGPNRRSVLRGTGIVTLGSAWAGTAAGDGEGTNRVTVRVVDSRTDDPINDFAISVNGGRPEADQIRRTDRDGVVEPYLPDGRHGIRAAAYPEYMHGVRTVDLDGEDVCVTIALPPGTAYDDERDETDRKRDEGEHTLTVHNRRGRER